MIFTNRKNFCGSLRVPADWEPHRFCFMAWAVHHEWLDWVDKVKSELSEIIFQISRFERIQLLTPPFAISDARDRFSGGNVDIVEAAVDDIWMRDIAPSFALRANQVVAIDWNFNGWGNTKERPARQGDRIASAVPSVFGVPSVSVSFVAEGGAFITDGHGTLVTTRSCLLNPNRNPVGHDKATERIIESELVGLGIRRVIWLEGDPSEPITSGHVDGYVMFTESSTVLVQLAVDEQCEPPLWSKRDMAILEHAEDANGHKIRVEKVRAPRKRHWKFRGPYWAPCYLNAYVANGAVISACFGDTERDEAAKDALELAFPARKVLMLRIDHIANGGGGIRCLTQPMASIGV
jgi:agmatine deiminase